MRHGDYRLSSTRRHRPIEVTARGVRLWTDTIYRCAKCGHQSVGLTQGECVGFFTECCPLPAIESTGCVGWAVDRDSVNGVFGAGPFTALAALRFIKANPITTPTEDGPQ